MQKRKFKRTNINNIVCKYIITSDKELFNSIGSEETSHMHLVFIPVVHTQDKKGNDIDKIACIEFWKEKDSYRMLQYGII